MIVEVEEEVLSEDYPVTFCNAQGKENDVDRKAKD